MQLNSTALVLSVASSYRMLSLDHSRRPLRGLDTGLTWMWSTWGPFPQRLILTSRRWSMIPSLLTPLSIKTTSLSMRVKSTTLTTWLLLDGYCADIGMRRLSQESCGTWSILLWRMRHQRRLSWKLPGIWSMSPKSWMRSWLRHSLRALKRPRLWNIIRESSKEREFWSRNSRTSALRQLTMRPCSSYSTNFTEVMTSEWHWQVTSKIKLPKTELTEEMKNPKIFAFIS